MYYQKPKFLSPRSIAIFLPIFPRFIPHISSCIAVLLRQLPTPLAPSPHFAKPYPIFRYHIANSAHMLPSYSRVYEL